ncbi:MAG: hypothetical protein V4588_02415, partial [Pseudomonadota bacterium]
MYHVPLLQIDDFIIGKRGVATCTDKKGKKALNWQFPLHCWMCSRITSSKIKPKRQYKKGMFLTKHSPAHVQQGNALAPKQQADASRSGECIYQAIGHAHGCTRTAHGGS